jgi:hypothetical protein
MPQQDWRSTFAAMARAASGDAAAVSCFLHPSRDVLHRRLRLESQPIRLVGRHFGNALVTPAVRRCFSTTISQASRLSPCSTARVL